MTYIGINGTAYGPSTNAPMNAGQYEASASFAGDANHTANAGAADFTIGKATSTTTTIGAGPYTYNGAASMPAAREA